MKFFPDMDTHKLWLKTTCSTTLEKWASMLQSVAHISQQSVPLIASQMAMQKRQFTLLKTCWEGNATWTKVSWNIAIHQLVISLIHLIKLMLFSRQIRTRVPVHPVVLVPQVCRDVPLLLEKRRTNYNEFYDRGSRRIVWGSRNRVRNT